MTPELLEIISREEKILKRSKNPNEKVNILYNLIVIKNNLTNSASESNIYVDIKVLLNYYIELIKINDFGYDLLCTTKILKVIGYLKLNEQLALLNYFFSLLTREFPELDKDWIQDSIKKVKIKQILMEKKILKLPQAFLLYSSLSVLKLLITFSILFVIIFIILLPTPYNWMAIFRVNYASYSDTFLINHLFNIISLFGGIKKGCEVIATNSVGLIVQLLGKILFLLIIVNFIYKKISDKISIK